MDKQLVWSIYKLLRTLHGSLATIGQSWNRESSPVDQLAVTTLGNSRSDLGAHFTPTQPLCDAEWMPV